MENFPNKENEIDGFSYFHYVQHGSSTGSVPISLISSFSGSLRLCDNQTVRFSSALEALIYSLPYLGLPELLSSRRVCKSLKSAIDGDVLVWEEVVVGPPLSPRLTDELLFWLTSKARGMLRSLALIDCRKITDRGLQMVVNNNPYITKLCLTGCSDLSVNGVVRAVQCLSGLKCLRLYGLQNITIQHLDILNAFLHVDQPRPIFFYNNWRSSPLAGDDHPIDVDICPKCKDCRIIFDCPRENCRNKMDGLSICRGCFWCIARCEECGGCVDLEELGEGTVCLHALCLECWLRLPKCVMCNQPSCSRHAPLQGRCTGSAEFTCERCLFRTEKWSDE